MEGNMTTQRSRRLCKKLRLGEFAELGFEIRFNPEEVGQQIASLARLSSEVLMPNEMAFYMREEAGAVFVFGLNHRTLSEADRASVVNWCGRQNEIASWEVGPRVEDRSAIRQVPTRRRRGTTVSVIAPGGMGKHCSTGIGRTRYPRAVPTGDAFGAKNSP